MQSHFQGERNDDAAGKKKRVSWSDFLKHKSILGLDTSSILKSYGLNLPECWRVLTSLSKLYVSVSKCWKEETYLWYERKSLLLLLGCHASGNTAALPLSSFPFFHGKLDLGKALLLSSFTTTSSSSSLSSSSSSSSLHIRVSWVGSSWMMPSGTPCKLRNLEVDGQLQLYTYW